MKQFLCQEEQDAHAEEAAEDPLKEQLGGQLIPTRELAMDLEEVAGEDNADDVVVDEGAAYAMKLKDEVKE